MADRLERLLKRQIRKASMEAGEVVGDRLFGYASKEGVEEDEFSIAELEVK